MARIVIKATDKTPAAEYILNMKNGMPYLKSRIHSSAKASPEQKRGILIFMSLTGAWRTLHDVIRKGWNENPEEAEAQFMNENTALLDQGKPMIICKTGEVIPPSIRTTPAKPGEILLAFDADPSARYLTVYAQTHGMHGAFAFEEIITDMTASPVRIENLAIEKEITLYCVFSGRPMEKATGVSALQSVKVKVR